jgi:hypothetical protein
MHVPQPADAFEKVPSNCIIENKANLNLALLKIKLYNLNLF